MALVVNTNVAALNAQRNLGITNSRLGKSLERLASGLRINRSADDAAGLAIATKLNAQVRGLNQAARNSNNAISLLQTAEGGINTVTNILQRLRELAVQSSSDDNTTSDRANLTSEADNLVAEVTRIVNTSEYNSSRLLDGSFSGQFFQIGANFGQNITFSISDTRGSAIGNIAKQDFDIADGVSTAVDGNFSTGEFTINSANVAATAATDDQYSVLDFSGVQIGTLTVSEFASALSAGDLTASTVSGSILAMSLNVTINSIEVGVRFSYIGSADVGAGISFGDYTSALATGASVAAGLVAAINNNASLAALNITARQVASEGWVIERKGGGNLRALVDLYGSAATGAGVLASAAYFSIFMGSGIGASTLSIVGDATVHSYTNAPTMYSGDTSAIAKAAAINSIKNTSGVTGTAQSNIIAMDAAVQVGAIAVGDVYINGYDLGAVTTALNDSTGALATAINAISTNTGVSAAVDSSTGIMTLTATDGRNITITYSSTTPATAIGRTGTIHLNTTDIFRSEVRMTDNAAITLSGTLGDLYESSTSAKTTKTTAVANTVALDTTQNVAAIDISTRDAAQDAILIVDSALDRVNTIRSQIGAVQNRLEFTISNLDIASENTAAAESRIRDADFAMETAAFTRNQIMVQAATAILAQANTMPQLALQLLS